MVSGDCSNTTRLYFYDDECEQFMHNLEQPVHSSDANANVTTNANANSNATNTGANLIQPCGTSVPAVRTPSRPPPRRPAVRPPAVAGAAAAGNARQPWDASTSPVALRGSGASSSAPHGYYTPPQDPRRAAGREVRAGPLSASGTAFRGKNASPSGLAPPAASGKKRSVQTKLTFQTSNGEKRQVIASDQSAGQNVVELNGRSAVVQFVGERNGTTNLALCPANAASGGAVGAPGVTGEQSSNLKIVTRSHFNGEQQSRRRSVLPPNRNLVLDALGTLDFTTAFRVLESLNGRPLESLYTIENIERLKTVPKADVGTYLLQLDGLQSRRNHDFREAKVFPEIPRYECCVNKQGQATFKISEQNEELNALQRCYGPDRVLRVFFVDETDSKLFLTDGIFVGLRHYEYWTHKDTKKDFGKKKKPVDEEFWSSVHCYFVCTSSRAQSDLSDPNFRQFKDVFEARCMMMHIHTTPNVAKYICRLQLALSNTQPVDLDFSTITLRVINDVHCKDVTGLETISTDGTGLISVDLAKEIAVSLKRDKKNAEKFGTQDYASLIQIRLFHEGSANKGTLLAHNTLPSRTIILRKSMRKVDPDPRLFGSKSFNSMEICGFSKRPRQGKLSRDLIVLLTHGGVPDSFFLELVDQAMEEECNFMTNARAAWDAIRDLETEKAKLAKKMLLAGIPPKEPFLQETLMMLRADLLQDFRKGSVNLPDSYNLYGTADPTGTLKPNQVAITLDHGLVSWPKVLVYKNPGKHPGDIHIFEAVANTGMQLIVGSGKYVIFFSKQGSRSVPDEIANSDLDGDKYFVSWNTKLLADFVEHPIRWQKSAPVDGMEAVAPRPADLTFEQLQHDLIAKFFRARFRPSMGIGVVANWWVEHMDQYLLLKQSRPDLSNKHFQHALELVQVFYALVDSEKSGIEGERPDHLRPKKSPHFMEREKSSDEKGQRSPSKSIYAPNKNDHSKRFGVLIDVGNPQGSHNSTREYKSTTILGLIYDKATREEERWRLQQSFDDLDFDQAFRISPDIPAQVFYDLSKKWTDRFKAYKGEMALHVKTAKSDVKDAGCESIYLKYRRLLYGADTFDKTRTDRNAIFENASVIYHVVYKGPIVHSESCPRLSFVWRVAGAALLTMYELHYRSIGAEQLIVSPLAFESLCGRKQSHDAREDDTPPSSPGWEDW